MFFHRWPLCGVGRSRQEGADLGPSARPSAGRVVGPRHDHLQFGVQPRRNDFGHGQPRQFHPTVGLCQTDGGVVVRRRQHLAQSGYQAQHGVAAPGTLPDQEHARPLPPLYPPESPPGCRNVWRIDFLIFINDIFYLHKKKKLSALFFFVATTVPYHRLCWIKWNKNSPFSLQFRFVFGTRAQTRELTGQNKSKNKTKQTNETTTVNPKASAVNCTNLLSSYPDLTC